MIKNLSPHAAFKRLEKDKSILFIDVRTFAENKFVGRVPNSVLIPWIDEPTWEINTNFVASIKNLTCSYPSPLDAQIILLCRSGKRSLEAGNALVKEGFTEVSHVASGFEGDLDEYDQRGNLNGWRHDGLPWIQC